MRIVSPTPNQVFTISSDTTAPVIESGGAQRRWTLRWRTYTKQGIGSSTGNWVSMQPLLAGLGGTLTITGTAAGKSAAVTVKIVGANPSLQELRDFTRPLPQGPDLLLILEHETHGRHFNTGRVHNGEPIVSFDGGYGISQLTTPRPTYEQCWSWKENVRGGIALFATKRADAIAFLSRGGRTYTPDQLRRETICRWNGGRYHEWNGTAWQRPANIVCAPGTGNIGWNTNLAANQDQTVTQLQDRDRDDYRLPHDDGDNWNYYGVCYVDSLLGG
ncbi:hypothetical protein [Sphingomonas sp.]|uniref:hypothetical protein n=1 Tax=Sphingomonas sp. TaxID=28214 RepID=UPI003B0008D9